MQRKNAYGVYFIFKSMEVGPTFRIIGGCQKECVRRFL